MAKKFDIYAKVRYARQEAGDIHNQLLNDKGYNHPDTKAWDDVEVRLNDIEMKLELLSLKED